MERVFDCDRITIGRGAGNDLVLKDPTRVVSTKHAAIRMTQGVWSICDVGSTNGTILNEKKLVAKEDYELQGGDRVGVGPYQLVFQPVRQLVKSDTSQGAAPSDGPAWDITEMNSERLRYILQRAYGDADGASDGNMEAHLESMLCRALKGFDEAKARSAVQSLRSSLRGSMGQVNEEQKETPAPQALNADASRQERKNQLFSDGIARKIYEELGVTPSGLDVDQMANQVAAVLDTLFTGLADAVQGRRAFQKEFEVEATRILAWSPNSIKNAESAAEIAAILLNPASFGLTDQDAIASLRAVLQDLTLHQIGLMAGFRECVRGLLKELEPESVGKTSTGGSNGKGLAFINGGGTRAEAAAWRRYVDKHRRLTEEEVKVFERILAPHFAKGYLLVHKTRRPS